MRDFKRLTMWSKAHALVLDVYRETSSFPSNELYGITSQLRRACTSIPTNIAEGAGRPTPVDFARFLGIASGSALEVEYLPLLSRDLDRMPNEPAENLIGRTIEVKKMLHAYSKRLHSPNAGGASRPL